MLHLLLLLPYFCAAPAEPATTEQLSLERLFASPSLDRGDLPADPQWRPGHASWTWVEDGQLREEQAGSGQRSVLLAGEVITSGIKNSECTPKVEAAAFSPDGNRLVLPCGEELLLCTLVSQAGGGAASCGPVATGAGEEEILSFSPDGSRIAYVREHDLYLNDLETGQELALSSDGSATVWNGKLDWVYWEELAGREEPAYRWSANGDAIVWLRLDDGEIPPFHHVDLLETHSQLEIQYYPKPGDPAPLPSLQVVRLAADRSIGQRTVITPRPAAQIPYLPRFGFVPGGSSMIWFQQLHRDQRVLELYHHDLSTGTSSLVVRENDPYWLRPNDLLHHLPEGSLLWGSRRSGFQHLYRVRGDSMVDLTPGQWEVTELLGVDAAGGHAWYQAARPSPLERRLYRVDLASGETAEVSTGSGDHEGLLSEDRSWLLVTSSSGERPPYRQLVRSDGSRSRTVDANECQELQRYHLGTRRWLEIPADDGTVLHAWLLLPPGFDSSRQYPVVVYTYGGPNAQVVRDQWGRSSFLFNRWLAHTGFVVFALDNRGSAGRGRDFEGAVFHRLGHSQLPDQLAGLRWLREQPFVDGDRIGIWGWSYGGYMTLFALTHAPDAFAVGVAVAPVTDWQLYDSIYTERYMGTPAANPDGYRLGSVLEEVDQLQRPVLVIHGTGDRNVHLQQTIKLADKAWRAGKQVDLQVFPNLGHGLRAPGSRVQVFRRIAGYLNRHLRASRPAE